MILVKDLMDFMADSLAKNEIDLSSCVEVNYKDDMFELKKMQSSKYRKFILQVEKAK